MLNIIDSVPDGLLSLPAPELYRVLPGPTLLHLKGRREPALFVATLLHGNEETGWEAARKLLSHYADKELPRSLSLFIGNIEAARHGQRYLDGQRDYNRVWNAGDSPEHRMMHHIRDEMQRRGIYLSLDIHNNTGKNPHYACVNKTYNEFLQIATLFSRTVVYFLRPAGVQSIAFSEICPSVTVECGLSKETSGIEHAYGFIDACLKLAEIPNHAVRTGDMDLFHTVAVVKIPEQYQFGFDEAGYDLQFDKEIEYFNFHELAGGTMIGRAREGIERPLDIRDEHDNDVSHQYFEVEDREIRSRCTVIPAMITTNSEIIRKDCLCYLMERYPLSRA